MNPNSRKFTDEQFIKLYEEGKTDTELSRILDVHVKTIYQRRLKLNLKSNHKKSLIPNGYKLKGHSGLYDKKGNLIQQWVKTIIDPVQTEEKIKKIKKVFKKILPKIEAIEQTITETNENLMTVIPLGDPHIGMMGRKSDTRDADWSLVIAEKLFKDTYRRLVDASPASTKLVVINLGDLCDRDNLKGLTPQHKNQLDTEGTFHDMFEVALILLRFFIEYGLTQYETVEVINVNGNHDEVTSICLNAALSHIYEKNERVIIQKNNTAFNYVKFGKVLLGAHHGDKVKMVNLPGIMAADMPEEWGQTKYRYWLTGHVHQDTKIDPPGCSVESFRTIAPLNKWAADKGYRSGRTMQSIVYHKENGEIERHIINI